MAKSPEPLHAWWWLKTKSALKKGVKTKPVFFLLVGLVFARLGSEFCFSVCLCLLLLSSVNSGVETEWRHPGATEGTTSWTPQVCSTGSAVQIQSASSQSSCVGVCDWERWIFQDCSFRLSGTINWSPITLWPVAAMVQIMGGIEGVWPPNRDFDPSKRGKNNRSTFLTVTVTISIYFLYSCLRFKNI